jgi:hypothetical protein
MYDSRLGIVLKRLASVIFLMAVSAAVGASQASAGWDIEGAELAAGSKAALASTAKVDSAAKLHMPGIKVTVECTGALMKATNPEIVGTSVAKAEDLTFEGCSTVEPASNCGLASSSIKTSAVLLSFKEGTVYPEDRATVKPETKTTLAEIPFNEGTACALEGVQPLKGQVTVAAPDLQQEEVGAQPIEGLGSTENNSLELGAGNKAFLTGGATLLDLTSGKAFGFELGLGKLVPQPLTYKFPNTVKKTPSAAEHFKFTWHTLIPGNTSGVLQQGEVGNGTEIAFKIVTPAGDKCNGMTLKKNQSCEVEVFFEPPMAMGYKGSVKIKGHAESEADIEGTGTP